MMNERAHDDEYARYTETPIGRFLLAHFSRREWVANRADPTVVTEWRSRGRRLVLLCSWGVEARLTLCGRTWRTYDNRFFVRLSSALEDAYLRHEAALEDDPMGSLGDYR